MIGIGHIEAVLPGDKDAGGRGEAVGLPVVIEGIDNRFQLECGAQAQDPVVAGVSDIDPPVRRDENILRLMEIRRSQGAAPQDVGGVIGLRLHPGVFLAVIGIVPIGFQRRGRQRKQEGQGQRASDPSAPAGKFRGFQAALPPIP